MTLDTVAHSGSIPRFALVVHDLPAHVTVLHPAPGDVRASTAVLAPFTPFDVVFPRLDRFPGILWPAPEPAEPLVAPTEAVVTRFPAYPPYGGRYPSVIPHLTLAEPLLPLHSHVDSVVLSESGDGRHRREAQTFDLAS